MTVLTVNAGSSSVRLAAYPLAADAPEPLARAKGQVESSQAASFLRTFVAQHQIQEIAVIAHRVVHGGDKLVRPTFVTEEIEVEIEKLGRLAPLHNPAAVTWIRACREVFGPVPQVAAFDTAFYAALPEVARTYALPADLAERFGLRRYGFHGLAHEAMWRRWCALHPERRNTGRVISLQLGSGCSITAINNGRPLDTSMGFTPLEGLVMATRPGDLDPGLLLHLQKELGLTLEELDELLHRRCGLLGVSGASPDMRALLSSEDPRARLAVELYCYRAKKYVGAYLAVLGGVDAIVFGGGVGENAPSIRAKILDGLSGFGLMLDDERNRAALGMEAPIHLEGATVQAWVLPVDEGALLAEAARAALRQQDRREE